MSKLEMAIAWRYLRSRRGSKLLSFISVVAIGGVIVGVSALIVITGVMNGLQKDLRNKILVASPDIRVLSYGDDLKIGDWQSVLARTKAVPGVVAAAPFVLSEGLISAGHNWVEAAQVVGIEPAGRGVPDVTEVRHHAIGGDFRFASTGGDRRGIVLGKLLADRLNAYPGDTVRMIAPPPAGKLEMNVLGTGFTPRFYEFEVTGTFETGMYEYDDRYVYLPLGVAQEFAGLGEAVSGLEVKTVDRWQADVVARTLTEKLGFPYRTVDWKEQNKTLFQALKLEKLGMAFITLLIAIVAAFNIVSVLTMVVVDKTREIGILKAMGMTARSIRRIFFGQGIVIGVVGTGVGLVLGVAASYALDRYKLIKLDPSVYFIDHLPSSMELFDVATIVIASLLIAAAATLHPARQAARLFPVEAIRHD